MVRVTPPPEDVVSESSPPPHPATAIAIASAPATTLPTRKPRFLTMTSPLHSDGTHIKTPFVGLVGEPNGLWNPHPNQAAAFPPTRSASAPKPSPVGSPGPTLHPQPLPSPVDRSGDGGRAGARPGSARAHRLATASRSTRSRFCLHFRVNKSPTALRGGHLSGLGSPADRPWPARSGRSSRCRCSSPWIPERSHERVRGRTPTVVSKDHTRIGLTGWS